MNIAYAVAVALIDGEAMAKQFSPRRIDQDDVWELIPKIVAHHEPDFDSHERTGSVRLQIRLADGRVLEESLAAPNSIGSPMTNDEIASKFRVLTADVIDPESRTMIEETVRNLDTVKDVAELVNLLGKPARGLFDESDVRRRG